MYFLFCMETEQLKYNENNGMNNIGIISQMSFHFLQFINLYISLKYPIKSIKFL